LKLTSLKNPEKLISLDATNNSLSEECLVSLKSFANFKELRLDNDKIFRENDNQSVLTRKGSVSTVSSTTSSIPLSPTSTITPEPSGFINNINNLIKKNTRKEKIQELTKQNEELTEKLEIASQKIERLEKENQELREQLIINLVSNPSPYRNILIIGRTGGGKSTLANVLLNKNKDFEEVFKEDKSCESVTRHIQVEEVEIKGIKYRIIDTVGIGDTGAVKGDDAKLEAIKAAYAIKDGISQIFFVVAGRDSVDERELKLYNLLKNDIFDENISKHITIVRTKFDYFTNEEKCKNDAEGLKRSR